MMNSYIFAMYVRRVLWLYIVFTKTLPAPDYAARYDVYTTYAGYIYYVN
jgi:hypothetical protein